MTTDSCASTEFGGFIEETPIVFQTAQYCSMEFDGWFRTNIPNDEEFELIE